MQERRRVLGQVGDPAGSTLHTARQRGEQPGDGAQQGGLAAAVGTGEGQHLAGPARQVQVLEHRHTGGAGAHLMEAPAERRRGRGIVARNGTGRRDRPVRGAGGDPPLGHQQATVGTLQDQVMAMLGHQRRGASLDGGMERAEQRRSPLRVQLRERFVEDQQAGAHRQHPGQGEPLPLAAGEGADRTAPEVGDAAHLQSVADPAEHLAASDAEVLQPKGDVALDGRIHGLQLGVLEDESDIASELAGRGADHIAIEDTCAAPDHAAVEVRDEPVADPQQGGLAAPGGAGEERQTGVDLQVHPVEGAGRGTPDTCNGVRRRRGCASSATPGVTAPPAARSRAGRGR